MTRYHEGTLAKNDCGRWEFDGYELTSGDRVEVLVGSTWVLGRIEYLHGSHGYALLLPSGPQTETILQLHRGMQARTPSG